MSGPEVALAVVAATSGVVSVLGLLFADNTAEDGRWLRGAILVFVLALGFLSL